MITIRSLELTNYLRYRGSHKISFRPEIYGVTCRWRDNADRSNFGGKCLPGNTVVYDPKLGPIPISEFVAKKRKRILGFSDGKIGIVPVDDWFTMGEKPMVKIGLLDGTSDIYGAQHPILTPGGFVRAGDLKVGMAVAKARKLISDASDMISESDAEMIGLMIGDGILGAAFNKFAAYLPDKRRRFDLLARELFPTCRVHFHAGTSNIAGKGRWAFSHKFGGAASTRKWAAKVGLRNAKSRGKRLPESVMRGSDRIAAATLRGLWLTDGYVSLTNGWEVSYTTASEGLVVDVQYLMRRLGLISTIKIKFISGLPYWTLRLTISSLEHFEKVVQIPGFKGKALKRLLQTLALQGRAPHRDVVPFELWSQCPLRTCVRTRKGRVRSICAWRQGRRGMSAQIFSEFGGDPKMLSELIWDRVVSSVVVLPQKAFDISVDTKEHIYIAGTGFVLTHNSSVLESIRHVLTGRHRKRMEDDWITRNCDEGGIRLELDCDNWLVDIYRFRKRGESTKLEVVSWMAGDLTGGPDGNVTAEPMRLKGDEAQLYIERLVGLTADDFDSSCYFGQKRMSQFITGQAGSRMDTIVGWLKLEKLALAADRAQEDLAAAVSDLKSIQDSRATVAVAVEQIFDFYKITKDQAGRQYDFAERFSQLTDALARMDAELADAKRNEQTFIDQAFAETAARAKFDDARRYHEAVQQGKALKARVEAYRQDVPTDVDVQHLCQQIGVLQGDAGAALSALNAKRMVARGEFDGRCPVADLQCPAKDQINASVQKNQKSLVKAQSEVDGLKELLAELRGRLEDAEGRRAKHARDIAQLEELRKEAKRYKDAADAVAALREPDELSTIDEDVLKVHNVYLTIAEQRGRLKLSIEQVQKGIVSLTGSQRQVDALGGRISLLREAHQILGRQGAQRVIARAAFDRIQRGADLALSRCGIDLTVQVAWERETDELAKHCPDCGAAFPKSRKQRECLDCGADRGAHYEQKFEVTPSDQSGGADDLAGIMVQLAAADWLRQDRGSGFGVALLDEPLAHLDRAHSRALAGHLPELLRFFGFGQSLVSAHDSSVMAGMPALIEITAGPNGSWFDGDAVRQQKPDQEAPPPRRKKRKS